MNFLVGIFEIMTIDRDPFPPSTKKGVCSKKKKTIEESVCQNHDLAIKYYLKVKFILGTDIKFLNDVLFLTYYIFMTL